MAKTKEEKLKAIQKTLAGIASGATGLTERVAKEGITKGGETILPPTIPKGTGDTGEGELPKVPGFDMETFQDWLMKTGKDIVSSEPTEIEGRLEEMVGGLEEERVERRAGIEAGHERRITERREVGVKERIAARERMKGLGPASTMDVMRQVSDDIDKDIKDLELRKTEAIATGDDRLVEQITNLQLANIQFKQQAKQQAFTNMLGLGGLGIQMAQQERLREQAEWQKQTSKLNFLAQNNLLLGVGADERAELEEQFGLPKGTLESIPPEKPAIFGTAEGGYYEQYYDAKDKVWKIRTAIGGTIAAGVSMDDGGWIDAIKGGWMKVGDIKDMTQRGRVIKQLSSRELGLEDDKKNIDFQLANDRDPDDLISQVWTSFNNNEVTAEEAEHMITYIQNQSVSTAPPITSGQFGEALGETVRGIPGGVLDVTGKVGRAWKKFTIGLGL